MTSRERTLKALNHQTPDKVPLCLAYETPATIAARYDMDESLMRQDIYNAFIDLDPLDRNIRNRYLKEIPDAAQIDPWGVAKWHSSTGDTYRIQGPLQNMSHPDELVDFPFPSFSSDAVEAAATRTKELQKAGFAVQGAMSQTIFELAWAMYGMEHLMVAFAENPAFVHRLLDEITARKKDMAVCFAKGGVDILRLGDDVGTQHGMMISPDRWREFLKPRLAEIIAAARNERPELPIFYHSDGDIREIIDELIEIGVTILNPVQPECMDPFEIKQRYGDRLTLWGTIGTQSLLPFGTPAQIRRTVRDYIRILGADGGYVIGPTHSINRDVSRENIIAFYEAVQEFG